MDLETATTWGNKKKMQNRRGDKDIISSYDRKKTNDEKRRDGKIEESLTKESNRRP